MGENLQHHFTILSPVTSGSQGIALITFDHAEDGFHLPSLAVIVFIKIGFHFSAIRRFWQLGRRPAVFRRDGGLYMMHVSGILMIRLAVVSGVRQKMLDTDFFNRGFKRLAELINIDTGAACGEHRQDHMVETVADDRQPGKTPIGGLFKGLALFGAFSLNEVSADTACFQAGGIECRQRYFFVFA